MYTVTRRNYNKKKWKVLYECSYVDSLINFMTYQVRDKIEGLGEMEDDDFVDIERSGRIIATMYSNDESELSRVMYYLNKEKERN